MVISNVWLVNDSRMQEWECRKRNRFALVVYLLVVFIVFVITSLVCAAVQCTGVLVYLSPKLISISFKCIAPTHIFPTSSMKKNEGKFYDPNVVY